jgi:uncharacterized protein
MNKTLPDGFLEILRVEVGSTVHGCNVDTQDDLDLMGVCIETPDHICGLKPFQQLIYRDAWERTKLQAAPLQGDVSPITQPPSQPGDLDLVVYSLRKWCGMALKGNPSALLLLYSPKVHIKDHLGEGLRLMRRAFRSKAVGYAYLGYAYEQRQRLEGKRGQKNVTRADLVMKYGYDTKYAYHILRLGIQGLEYARTGDITVPMKADDRAFLIDVRTGGVTLESALQLAEKNEEELRRVLLDAKECVLPDAPDREAVDQFLVYAYQTAWQRETR